jgi:hypothetical protein
VHAGIGARDGAPEKPARTTVEEGDVQMTVTIPVVAIVGLVVFIAYRYMGLRAWHALVSLLFGFLLAATSAASQINHILAAIAAWVHR